ncbi:BRO family protein [Clostridium baratii]|uniref:BRO family protein n=1 Tax=Clostridium baratii TaxID=1561 RepID=UPI002A750354|nr:BRO family protein [Clostridium baratii]MDY3206708.1 BRO family protein [Clostridium baratii]
MDLLSHKVYGTKEEILFLAKDVAEWIEHSKPNEMIARVDEEEKLVLKVLIPGDIQKKKCNSVN